MLMNPPLLRTTIQLWFAGWEYTMKDLKKRNVNVVYIDTGGDNAKAIRLYEKMGFREFGRTIHFKKIIG